MHIVVAGLALLAPPSQTDLLTTVRSALSVSGPQWKSTILSGKATYYSEPSTYSLQFDSSGKFLQVIKGPLGESYGYDGNQYWVADRSGATRSLSFCDVDVQQAFLLVQNNGWLNPPAGVTVTSGVNTINITLASGLEEKLSIDPLTHLPTQATYTITPGEVTIKLSDWRPAGAWKVPFKTEVSVGGLTDTFIAETAAEATSEEYSMPAWTPQNITFDKSQSAAIETKKLLTGHLIVHPLINGKDVGWFILDSGADIMVVDPVIADRLNMPKVGMLPLVGVGGIVTEPFRTMVEMKLGPVTLRNTQCAELDLSMIKEMFGIDVAGIVGYDLFRRSIVSVDLNKPSVSLHEPSAFKLSQGSWTPSKFNAGNIAVEASMEGDRKAWYRLDTGANGTVQFHTPYVTKEDLLNKRDVTESQQAGVGGTSAGMLGTIDWFELAGHRFEKPQVVFSQATIGAFNDRYLAGNIGQEFMKPFTIHFDFGGSRVAFVPKG